MTFCHDEHCIKYTFKYLRLFNKNINFSQTQPDETEREANI